MAAGAPKQKKFWWRPENFVFCWPPPRAARGLLDYGYLERASLVTECHWPAPPTHLHLKWKENYDRYRTRYETGMLGSESFRRAWLPNPKTRRVYSARKPKCIGRSQSFQEMMGSEPKTLHWKSSLVPKFQEPKAFWTLTRLYNRRWVPNNDKLRHLGLKMHTN